MAVDIEYLLGFLQDELSNVPDIRIGPVAPSGTKKAQDLPQDYDAESNDIHLQRGVRVRLRSREFYFPATWVNNNQLDKVHALVKEIREFI